MHVNKFIIIITIEIITYISYFLQYEFWTRSNDPTYDRENINFLYNSGFLLSNNSDLFWDSFYQALNANKKGLDGKRRILSIIAEKFSYNILMEKLKVSIKLNQIKSKKNQKKIQI